MSDILGEDVRRAMQAIEDAPYRCDAHRLDIGSRAVLGALRLLSPPPSYPNQGLPFSGIPVVVQDGMHPLAWRLVRLTDGRVLSEGRIGLAFDDSPLLM